MFALLAQPMRGAARRKRVVPFVQTAAKTKLSACFGNQPGCVNEPAILDANTETVQRNGYLPQGLCLALFSQ